MGQIVGALGTSHVLMAPDCVEAQAERVFEGMKRIGMLARACEPDVIVLIASDHLNNFKLGLQPPFVVGMCDSYEPLGDMGVPRTVFRGHRAFAEDLVRYATGVGFDLAVGEDIRPDHGVSLPNAIINPKGDIPVVPLYVNTAMAFPPSPRRVWDLGEALRQMVQTVRPADERVVVVATGGLSHWICMPDQGRVNQSFDRQVIQALCTGNGQDLSAMTNDELMRDAGNGGLEILNWICMAATVPAARGELIYYEAIPDWLTGLGGVRMSAEVPA